MWMEKIFLYANSTLLPYQGYHLTTDECNRYWFSLGLYGIQIFNSQGLLIGDITQKSSFIFEMLISENYVIYLSNTILNQIRIDLTIQC
ncbi:unnamed protein product [Rotaria sp. Silwood2]|nr:unnamed protein product [Rotaria sp. Silwood2]CAF3164512.1 unnamed protein product [Rotaria sp. Silwood2]CAF3528296.1 unnamed protein product [Rotaria sp. Silwood2]CAF3865221.1 unnamed protein product [Rotaria sp. Silwood2]CAF4040373.1 unnamed protein product [Rotaria sp. Silwood2]